MSLSGMFDLGKAKGRRLKRFLGLRRAKGVSFHGGIDRLLPGRLMGWVMAADTTAPFYEVRLLVGPHLIARAEINKSRPDVCEQLGREGYPGFVMPLPVDLPLLDFELPVRVLAVSADGISQAELPLMEKKGKTEERIRALLQSDCLGMDGHVDGVLNGELVGWAGRRGQHQPASIWLHAEALEPIGIPCSQRREGMANLHMPNQCGFSVALDSLPPGWTNKSIWCSFDKDGQWRIPQDQKLTAHTDTRLAFASLTHQPSENITEVVTDNYSPQVISAPEDLQDHWRALEDFRIFLDGLEQEVDRRDQIRASQREKQGWIPGWARKLIGPVG